jgi:multidrug efflux system membrane fusion protein
VVKPDNTVQIRPLKLGPTEGDRVQVIDGLAANDPVVVDGVDKLREGALVEVIDATARAGGVNGKHGPDRADAKESRKNGPGSP